MEKRKGTGEEAENQGCCWRGKARRDMRQGIEFSLGAFSGLETQGMVKWHCEVNPLGYSGILDCTPCLFHVHLFSTFLFRPSFSFRCFSSKIHVKWGRAVNDCTPGCSNWA